MIIEVITAEYIQSVEDLGTAIYPSNYYEGQESFKSKIIGYPRGCYLARKDKQVVGYIISFPYVLNEVYPINEHYAETLEPNCLYIHDLCVSKDHRGEGIAKALVAKTIDNELSPKALVSVMKSERFWHKFGFISQRSFDYYGGIGHYMIRQY
jgi:ribosomal protein S18 acetylase RimI-like enzyme